MESNEYKRGYDDGLFDGKNHPDRTHFISTSKDYTRGYFDGQKAAKLQMKSESESEKE